MSVISWFQRHLWLALLLSSLGVAQAAPEFPALSGRVVDGANLLTDAAERELSAALQQHEQATSNQIVVVTLDSLQGYEIADYGYQLGRHWGIGQADKDNGALLIVAPNERRTRIEVGYGLEGVLTDALSKQIIETEIIPRFKQGNFEAGIKAGVQAILGALGSAYVATEVTPVARQSSGQSYADDDRDLALIIPMVILSVILDLFMNALVVAVLAAIITFAIGTFIGGTLSYGIGTAFAVLFFFMMTKARFGGGVGGSRGGGWSGGGGGFSGGGGSFGGGGASGGW